MNYSKTTLQHCNIAANTWCFAETCRWRWLRETRTHRKTILAKAVQFFNKTIAQKDSLLAEREQVIQIFIFYH